LESLRQKCHISREGVSLLGISEAAEGIGFKTIGVHISFEQLKEDSPLPCIVHWRQNHFVVVYAVAKHRSGTTVCVADPIGGIDEFGLVGHIRKRFEIGKTHRGDSIREKNAARKNN